MKTIIARAALLVIVLAFSIPALADIPRPPKQSSSSEKVRMVIHPDNYATESTLRIPRNLFKHFQSVADTEPGSTPSRLYPIMAGIFLSLALMVGGVLMFRYHRKTNRQKAVVAAVLALVAASAIAVSANAPVRRRPIDADALKLQSLVENASGKVRVEIVPEGDQIDLIVPTGNR